MEVHILRNSESQLASTGWQRRIGYLIFIGHFQQNARFLGALLREETCTLRHPMHVCHPVKCMHALPMHLLGTPLYYTSILLYMYASNFRIFDAPRVGRDAVYIYIYLHIYIYIYVYTYLYIHTYIYIYIYTRAFTEVNVHVTLQHTATLTTAPTATCNTATTTTAPTVPE